jgi:DNA-binding transcriptional LysR family regulator
MMEEHGVEVDHATLNRWVIKHVPLLERQLRAFRHPAGPSWRMDETYVRVKGTWEDLYRAVDRGGPTVGFLLTAKRDRKGALRFLRKAIRWKGRVRRSRSTRAVPTRRRSKAPMPTTRGRIAAIVADFTETHPDLSIELVLTDERLDGIGEAFDIGLHVDRPSSVTVVLRKLLGSRRVLCASAAYLDQHGTPTSAADLDGHRWIRLVRSAYDRDRLAVQGRRHCPRIPGRGAALDQLLRSAASVGASGSRHRAQGTVGHRGRPLGGTSRRLAPRPVLYGVGALCHLSGRQAVAGADSYVHRLHLGHARPN